MKSTFPGQTSNILSPALALLQSFLLQIYDQNTQAGHTLTSTSTPFLWKDSTAGFHQGYYRGIYEYLYVIRP